MFFLCCRPKDLRQMQFMLFSCCFHLLRATRGARNSNLQALVVQMLNSAIHQWIVQLVSLIFICWIVIHPVGSTIQCLNNQGQHVCSQHSFRLPLRMYGMHRTQFDHVCLDHPRGPRGSQSCRVKRHDKSFQAWAEEPLGIDSHRTISKWSRECWFLIGHKKCFVLLCPIGKQFLLSSSCDFVHDG